jgi:hypothetical protein
VKLCPFWHCLVPSFISRTLCLTIFTTIKAVRVGCLPWFCLRWICTVRSLPYGGKSLPFWPAQFEIPEDHSDGRIGVAARFGRCWAELMPRASCEVRLLLCAPLLACSAASIWLRPRPTGGAARYLSSCSARQRKRWRGWGRPMRSFYSRSRGSSRGPWRWVCRGGFVRECGLWGCAMAVAPAVRQQSLTEGLISCEDWDWEDVGVFWKTIYLFFLCRCLSFYSLRSRFLKSSQILLGFVNFSLQKIDILWLNLRACISWQNHDASLYLHSCVFLYYNFDYLLFCLHDSILFPFPLLADNGHFSPSEKNLLEDLRGF